jgi:acetyl-CoA C-acetyltransferase
MASFDDVVILSGCRTAVGKFQGSLSDLSAPQLGAIAVREAVKRAGVDPAQVDECIMGNVLSAGLGQNPARQAAIYGGLSPATGAMTINKVCGSGLKSVALAAQAIQTGNSSIVVAGGMESMTNAPYLLPQARKGYRLGNAQIIDSMVHDGLWDIYNDYHMGITGENVAEKYGITREEQDEFALHSHRKALSAIKECRLKSQIVPVEIPAKKNHRSAARSEARVQEGRNRYRRECARSQRRRCRPGRHQCEACSGTRKDAPGPHRGPGNQRGRTQMGHDGARGRRANNLGEDRLEK